MRNKRRNDAVRGVKSVIGKAASAAAAAAATVIAENIVRQLRPGSSAISPKTTDAVRRLLDEGDSPRGKNGPAGIEGPLGPETGRSARRQDRKRRQDC
jgi:hypothetical protein